MEQQYKPRPPVTTGSPQRALHRTRPLQPPSIDRARLTVGGADTVLWLQRQAGNSVVAAALGPVVQRRIRPEDLAGDLAGLPFALGGDLTIGAVTLAAGDEVTVVSWDNAATTVRVRVPAPHLAAGSEVDVPKKLLRPVSTGVPGIASYGVGVDRVVRDYERGEQAIAGEQARRGGGRAAVLAELQRLQANRERLLNKRLIQGAMLNRFDPSIRTWVDYYNQLFRYTTVMGVATRRSLDPNLVKSMIFQETQMGTAGEHLEDPTEHDPKVKTRQNLGQVIDSSAAALYLMISEEEPTLITTHSLENLERDARASPDAEEFMWNDPGFAAAVTEYFRDVPAGSPARNLDYDFWVKAAVRWLFNKRRSVSSWEEAIRAYNGGGARARHYRDAVSRRSRAARHAQRAGTAFVPDRL